MGYLIRTDFMYTHVYIGTIFGDEIIFHDNIASYFAVFDLGFMGLYYLLVFWKFY